MSEPPSRTDTYKFIAGAAIVAAAACIMFPGFLSLAAGLGRMLLMLVVVGGGCLFLTITTRRLLKLKQKDRHQPRTEEVAAKSIVAPINSDNTGDRDSGKFHQK